MGRKTARREWNSGRIEKAVNPGILAITNSSRGQGGQPRRFGLMDALNLATNHGMQPGNELAGFRELPRDPADDGPFGPGQPIRPEAIDPLTAAGRTEPRVWEYPQSWNLPGNNRREVPWQVLRASSIGVDIIRRCIEARKKHARDLQWSWSVRPQVVEDAYAANTRGGYDDAAAALRTKYASEINRLTQFWEKPWRSQGWTFGQWINSLMEEYLVLDAVAIYPRMSLGGDVLDMEQVDGSTIKPLLDHRGARPLPPHPAYQQEIWGFPRGEWAASATQDQNGNVVIENGFAASELFYYRENTRVYSPYGLSAVEQALISARLYLKRQGWMLAEYDDGSTPLTVWELPEEPGREMTPKQRREWEQTINAELAGQQAARHRMKVGVPGWKVHQLSSADERYKPDFDLFLVKLVCGHLGMTATDLGFSETTGLGSAGWQEGQAEVGGKIGRRPDVKVLADVINDASRQFLTAPPELEFSFNDPAAANDKESDDVTNQQRTRATITLNDDRRLQKLPLLDDPEADMPFLITGTGPVFIKDAFKRAEEQASAAVKAQEATAEGTTGKLELEQAKLEDGQAAREEDREFARETREAEADTTKAAMAEVAAFRTWRRRNPEPKRPFVFKAATPDDWPELAEQGPDVADFGDDWVWLTDIEKGTWLEWNAAHPNKPRGPNGRWVKRSALVELMKDLSKVEPFSDVTSRAHEQQIRDTFERLRPADVRSRTPFLGLADLRNELGNLTREEQDAALRRLLRQPDVRLIPVANSKALEPRDWAAELRLSADNPVHAISIDPENVRWQGKDPNTPRPPAPKRHRPTGRQLEVELIALRDELRFAEPGSERHDLLSQRLADLESPESRARTRQQAIDHARARAEHLAEIEEALIGGVDRQTLGRIAGASVRRRSLASDPTSQYLLDMLDSEDMFQAEMPRALAVAANLWGVRRDESGDLFDLKRHKAVGERLRPGQPIELVRPGYSFTHEGEDIVLARPVVDKRLERPLGPEIEIFSEQSQLTSTQVMQGDYLTPAGRRAIGALGPAGHPRIAAIPDTEGKIRETYRMLATPGVGTDFYVALSNVRKLIGEQVSREEVDATLRDMSFKNDVYLSPQHYARSNAETRIPAALIMGGQEIDHLYVADPTLARPSQFGAIAMAGELSNRRAGRPGDPVMAMLSDAELQAEIDRRVARDPVVARDLAERGLTKAADPGDGGADPKVSTPPDQRWPGWEQDLAIAAATAAAITAAMTAGLTTTAANALAASFTHWARTWQPGQPVPDVKGWLHATTDLPEVIEQAITAPIVDAWTQAYMVGARSADAVLEQLEAGISPRSAVDVTVDWGGWQPGDVAAARRIMAADGSIDGFEQLLRDAGVTIKGISGNRLAAVAKVLADGLENGLGPDEIAKNLVAVVGDVRKARDIAVTETNRAMSAATLDTYREGGIVASSWMTATDQRVCLTCFDNEFEAPGVVRVVPIGQRYPSGDYHPPAHPNCRCALVPVLDDELVGKAAGGDHWRRQHRVRGGKHGGEWSKMPSPASFFKRPGEAPFRAAETNLWGGNVTEGEPDQGADERIRQVFEGTFGGLAVTNVRITEATNDMITVKGDIHTPEGAEVGYFLRAVHRDEEGKLAALHMSLQLDPTVQGQGFSHTFNRHLTDWYRANGVDRIELHASDDVGGYAWARAGYDWLDEAGPRYVGERLYRAVENEGVVTPRFDWIPADRRTEQLQLAQQMWARFSDYDVESDDYPTPFDVSQLGRWPGAGKDDWWIGKVLMMGSSWHGVKPL